MAKYQYTTCSNGRIALYNEEDFENAVSLEKSLLIICGGEAYVVGADCIDYDQMNFNFVYSMEDGIRLYQDFDSIYKKYAEKFNALYKVVKVNKMKEELKKLEEAD